MPLIPPPDRPIPVARPDGTIALLLRVEALPLEPPDPSRSPAVACCQLRYVWHAVPDDGTAGDDAAVAAPFGGSAPAITLPETLIHAVPRRLAAFAAGRLAARAALAAAGCPPSHAHIAREPLGAPRWPTGFVGSIAHTDSHAIAMVATSPPAHGLGVDLEAPLSDTVAGEVGPSVAPELRDPNAVARVLHGDGAMSFPDLLTLVFTAKEALYKALAPRVGRFFGFEAAECVAIRLPDGVVSLRLTEALDGGFAAGRIFDVRIAKQVVSGLVLAWLVDAPGDLPTSRPVC